MARKQRQRLGEILSEWGVVTPAGVKEALEHGRQHNLRIGEAMVALTLADEEEVTKALATQYDMEYIDLDNRAVVPSEMLIPEELIRKHQIVPLSREDGKLRVI